VIGGGSTLPNSTTPKLVGSGERNNDRKGKGAKLDEPIEIESSSGNVLEDVTGELSKQYRNPQGSP